MGTCIEHIDRGNLQQPDGVERIVNWINEIHLWGLGKYAERVRDYIEGIEGTMKKENQDKRA